MLLIDEKSHYSSLGTEIPDLFDWNLSSQAEPLQPVVVFSSSSKQPINMKIKTYLPIWVTHKQKKGYGEIPVTL